VFFGKKGLSPLGVYEVKDMKSDVSRALKGFICEKKL
jgi:hypothetical protein